MTKAFSVTNPAGSSQWTRIVNCVLAPAANSSAGAKHCSADLNWPCGIRTETIVKAAAPRFSSFPENIPTRSVAASRSSDIWRKAIFGSVIDSAATIYLSRPSARSSCWASLQDAVVDHAVQGKVLVDQAGANIFVEHLLQPGRHNRQDRRSSRASKDPRRR